MRYSNVEVEIERFWSFDSDSAGPSILTPTGGGNLGFLANPGVDLLENCHSGNSKRELRSPASYLE